jgi:ribosomal protein S18 acetylase RimI-like enzyme
MLRVRLMTAADLPLGLRLSRQAGWNQTEADWRRLLGLQPDGCFVAEWAGTPAGTTVTCIFGPVAWVAMVLVEESARGRGVGTALLREALAFLDRQQLATVRLDATPQGRPLYERLGFVEQFQVARYEGVLPPAPGGARRPPARAEHWPALAALDGQVTGLDRSRMLLRLFAEQPGWVHAARRGDRCTGFLAARPGDRAVQLGPWVGSLPAARRLVADACADHAGRRVLLDVPVPNAAAVRLAKDLGLTVQRFFTRMWRGAPARERLEGLWASSGPEKG